MWFVVCKMHLVQIMVKNLYDSGFTDALRGEETDVGCDRM